MGCESGFGAGTLARVKLVLPTGCVAVWLVQGVEEGFTVGEQW